MIYEQNLRDFDEYWLITWYNSENMENWEVWLRFNFRSQTQQKQSRDQKKKTEDIKIR